MADEPKTVSVKVLRDRHLFADIDDKDMAKVPEREALTLASLGLIEYTPSVQRKESTRG